MALLDLLGRRWALRIMWELRDGRLGFRELQGRCGGMSPSVLSTRLRELSDAQIVGTGDDGAYGLTAEGERLMRSLAPVNQWAKDWAGRQSGDR